MRRKIIDTFPDFMEYWEFARNTPASCQVENWQTNYMSKWPELLQKQISSYESQNEDWRKIAQERIFPISELSVLKMMEARENIISSFDQVCKLADGRIGLQQNVTGLIYVGIGCGAGWATTYRGNPVILFGLENIVDCGWCDQRSIRGLIAHELGHIFHAEVRGQESVQSKESEWWQLYTEGFAQRCEHLILGQETWHEAISYGDAWISWCEHNRSFLAAEFLRCSKSGIDIRPFFGSWFEINGYSQCGYFLGHEAIKSMQSDGKDIREIALLENPEEDLQEILEKFAQ